MNTYDIGDTVRLSLTVAGDGGVGVDPTGLTVRVRKPDGTTTVLTYPTDITKDSVGHYHADVDITLAGRWYYRALGTGTNKGADEETFSVRKAIAA